MRIDEDLIREALLKSNPGDLDDVLSAIEAYRLCGRTAQKLHSSSELHPQVSQVTECAEYCESVLADYAATGRLRRFHYPNKDFGCAHFNLKMEW